MHRCSICCSVFTAIPKTNFECFPLFTRQSSSFVCHSSPNNHEQLCKFFFSVLNTIKFCIVTFFLWNKKSKAITCLRFLIKFREKMSITSEGKWRMKRDSCKVTEIKTRRNLNLTCYRDGCPVGKIYSDVLLKFHEFFFWIHKFFEFWKNWKEIKKVIKNWRKSENFQKFIQNG